MDGIKLSFVIEELPCFGLLHSAGRRTFEYHAFDGILTCAAQYDYNRQALEMEGEVKLGDKVDIVLMPHRIELYINEALTDEEWPAGKGLVGLDDGVFSSVSLTVSPYTEEKRDLPDIISTFRNAEGWYPGNGVFVGDCMPYVKGDEYHVLYLKDRHHHRSKWKLGAHQWEHISTKDFDLWRVHPMAVPITDPIECSICTGSWVAYDGKEYLFYTVRRGGNIPAPIRRSVSSDGYHFEKDKDFGFTLSDKYEASSARDPKIIRDDEGVFHLFITTALAESRQGCLAHYLSRDLDNWEDYGEPIYVSADRYQPECPDYIRYNGRYYLIFSIRGKARYMYSESPFDDWHSPENDVIPCAAVPKGAVWGDRIVFVGYRSLGGYAGAMTFRPARADEKGELIFDE